MPFSLSLSRCAPVWLALAACALAHATDCHLDAMNREQRAHFEYLAPLFTISQSYTLGTPFKLKPGDSLVYRKLGRRHQYFVPSQDIVYAPAQPSASAPTLTLRAGMRFAREYGAEHQDVDAIRFSGKQGVTNFLYVNVYGELCEAMGEISPAPGGQPFGTAQLIGPYVATPANARLDVQYEPIASFAEAVSITLDEAGPDRLRLTYNHFDGNALTHSSHQDIDRNVSGEVTIEGWRLALRKLNAHAYEATVLFDMY